LLDLSGRPNEVILPKQYQSVAGRPMEGQSQTENLSLIQQIEFMIECNVQYKLHFHGNICLKL